MVLIGQYDSPFVRRVAIAMLIYGIPYEHRRWSTFRDADALAEFNPLRRVPTLILADGEVLVESSAILDHLDQLAGAESALVPVTGDARRGVLRVCAIATGACDKMVGLVYELMLHDTISPVWVKRCETQVGAALDVLDAELLRRATDFWFGGRITHADIAVACVIRFVREALGGTFEIGRWPNLIHHAEMCEALDPFKATVQVFIPPTR
ncbi:MAG: glutathione S-transferase family protein [Devosia sp.]